MERVKGLGQILGLALIVGMGGLGGPLALGQTAPTETASQPATTTASTRPSQDPVLADITRLFADVPYGGPDEALNRLDIYAPAQATKAPVVLFVHGGEWSKGDKKAVSSKPRFFNEQGIVFVSVNYRLSPKDPHPAQVDDVARAFGWVKTHIGEYGGDASNIVLMGHSAGCHLVTYVSLDPTPLAKVNLKPSDIRATVAWSGGMYDLAARAKGPGMYPPFIKATFGESEEAQRAGSPLTYARNAKTSPTFLIASVDDEKSQSSRDASKQLADAINAAGGKAKTAILTGKSHFTANHEIGAPGDQTGVTLLEFIHSVCK